MENTSIATIPLEDVKELIQSAPAALEKNSQRVEKAEEVGAKILSAIEQTGMNTELDGLCHKYLANAKTAYEQIQAARKPVTQFFDRIKSRFTSLESRLDLKTPDSIPSKIQAARDQYAKKVREEQAEIERQKMLKIQTETERSNIRARIETELNNWFISGVKMITDSLTAKLNNCTLETFAVMCDQIRDYPEVFTTGKFSEWEYPVASTLVSKDEIKEITAKVKEETLPEFYKQFTDQISTVKQTLMDRFAGRKKMLEELAEAEKKNKARAAELRAQEDQRIKDEQAKADALAEKAKADSAQKADMAASAHQAEIVFQAEVVAAEGSSDAPKGRESVKITIDSPMALPFIFQKWFEIEGKTWTPDQIEKKFSFMFRACEKHTKATGETITFKHIHYGDNFKTTVKR